MQPRKNVRTTLLAEAVRSCEYEIRRELLYQKVYKHISRLNLEIAKSII